MTLHCWFGNVSVKASIVNNSSVECLSPRATTPRVVDFEVRTGMSRFTSDGLKFEYVEGEMVSVDIVSPSFGSTDGGTRVAVRWCCGKLEGRLSCLFGGSSLVEAKTISDGMVECFSPRAKREGPSTVHLARDGEMLSSQGGKYTYVLPAKISWVHPSSGTPRGSTMRVTVTGENFVRTKELSCRFGSIMSPARHVASSLIDCDVSKLRLGNYTVEMTLNGEDFTKGEAVFQTLPGMVISHVVPSIGSKRGGSTVLVVGAGMREGSSLACHFGDQATTHGTFVSQSEVKCASPATASLPATVSVSLSMGRETSEGMASFRMSNAAAFVEDITPRRGVLSGGTRIVVRGEHFRTEKSTCVISGLRVAASEIESSTQVTCIMPAHESGSVTVEVVGEDDESSDSGLQFLYEDEAEVDAIEPARVWVSETVLVTMTGRHFSNSPDLTCSMDGGKTRVQAEWIHSGRVVCPLSTGLVSGNWFVQVSNNGQDWTGRGAPLMVIRQPLSVTLSPSSGPVVGGTLVTVTGFDVDSSFSGLLSCVLFSEDIAFHVPIRVAALIDSESRLRFVTPSLSHASLMSFGIDSDGHMHKRSKVAHF